MKKKALASKRNRHKGRINAYKQWVIDGVIGTKLTTKHVGKTFITKDRKKYASMPTKGGASIVRGY